MKTLAFVVIYAIIFAAVRPVISKIIRGAYK